MIANVPRLSSEPLTLTLQRPTRADFTNHGLAEPLRGEARDLTQYQEITQTVEALEGFTPQPNKPPNRTPPLYPYNRARY